MLTNFEISDKSIRQLIRDIKANGSCYIRSASIARKVKEADSSIKVEWQQDEMIYIAMAPDDREVVDDE